MKAKKRFYCKICQKSYPSPCYFHTWLCFLCQSPDHQAADCPRKQVQPLDDSDPEESNQQEQPPTEGTFTRVPTNRRREGNQGQPQLGDNARKLVSQGCSAVATQTSMQQRNSTLPYPVHHARSKKKRIYCKRCQRSHPGPCPRCDSRCFICQSLGHWKANCPRKQGRLFDKTVTGGGNQPTQSSAERMSGRGQVNPRHESTQGLQLHGG